MIDAVIRNPGFMLKGLVKTGSAASLIGIAAVSCSFQVAPERQVPTNIPVGAQTSTETPPPYPTATVEPTKTSTPEPTTTRTRIPDFKWTGIENNWDGTTDNGHGVKLDIANGIYRYTITRFTPLDDSFRLYPFRNINPPEYPVDWSLASKIKFGKGFLNGSASVLNVFIRTGSRDSDYRVLAAVDIGSRRVPTISIHDPVTGPFWARYTSNVAITEDEENSWELYTSGPHIYLARNNQVVASGPLHPDYIGKSPRMIKSGAYGRGSEVGSFMEESVLQYKYFKAQ